jgi:phenylalanyl-tRNA synthetase beta chain
MRTIREQAGPLLRSVEPFDLYEGERISKGKKSIAFSLRFGADRTLLDEEVDERVDAVVGALAKNHGGELRG